MHHGASSNAAKRIPENGIKAKESNVSFFDLAVSNKGSQSALLMVSAQYLLAFNLFELYLII